MGSQRIYMKMEFKRNAFVIDHHNGPPDVTSDTVNKILFLTGVITWLPLADLLIRNLIVDC